MDDDFQARVAHPNAPRINARGRGEDAPAKPPRPEHGTHYLPLLRTLQTVLQRHPKGGRPAEFDLTYAMQRYLKKYVGSEAQGAVIKIEGEGGEREIWIEFGSFLMTVAQFTLAIDMEVHRREDDARNETSDH